MELVEISLFQSRPHRRYTHGGTDFGRPDHQLYGDLRQVSENVVLDSIDEVRIIDAK
jgi:hypothetical protein